MILSLYGRLDRSASYALHCILLGGILVKENVSIRILRGCMSAYKTLDLGLTLLFPTTYTGA
jgi:hypothetical protein